MTSQLGSKVMVQHALRAVGLYDRFRTSWLYDAYWRIFQPAILTARDREIDFYRRLLGNVRPGDVIFDIGANLGYKTDIFLRLGATVVAADPDPVNQEILRRRFHRLRITPRPVHVVDGAVSAGTGTSVLYIAAPGSAKNTMSKKWVDALALDHTRFGERLDYRQSTVVRTVTLQELIATHGMPLFIKIDVEGHEASALRGLRVPVPFVSFEVNLPDFLDDGIECATRLASLDPSAMFCYNTALASSEGDNEWMSLAELARCMATVQEDSLEVFARSPVALANHLHRRAAFSLAV